MEIGLIVIVVVMAVVILALVIQRIRSPELDLSPIDKRLDSLNQRLGEVTGQAATYQQTLNSVNQTLGGLTKTSQRILEVGKDMQKLQEVLAAPTLRGGLGELMLEELLRQTLPVGFYEMQHTFRNGTRVDAVIRLTHGLVSVDAKFPLESFSRLMEGDDTERKKHRSQFRRDVSAHIDAIAENYICPGETLDFALMYIPAENVYYEIVLTDKKRISYGWSKRVIPTSPNSFYAYLQVIALGLRGLQVEQNACWIPSRVSKMILTGSPMTIDLSGLIWGVPSPNTLRDYPSWNRSNEIVLKEDGQKEDILNYGWSKRVIPTSPNSFYAYLQVIALGLRGLQVEQNARQMLDSLSRLQNDFDRFADDYRLIGTHLGRAQSKYSEGLPKLESIQRALPGQLTTAPAIEVPETDEVGEGVEQEALPWDYKPSKPKQGRPDRAQ